MKRFLLVALCLLALPLSATADEEVVQPLIEASRLAHDRGDFATALAAATDAEREVGQLADSRLRVEVLAALGNAQAAMGLFADAEKNFVRALELAVQSKDARLQAVVSNDHGNLEVAAGRSAAGLERYRQAATLAARHELSALAAVAQSNAARVSSQLDDAGTAFGALGSARAALANLNSPQTRRLEAGLTLANALTALRIARLNPELLAALEAGANQDLARAVEIANSEGDQRLLSEALGFSASFDELSGRLDLALDKTREALLVAEAGRSPRAVYRWQWQLARIRRARNETDLAIRSHRDAAQTYVERIRPTPTGSYGRENSFFISDVKPLFTDLVDLLLERAWQRKNPEDRSADRVLALSYLEELKAEELRDYFQDDCVDSQLRPSPAAIAGTLVVYPVILKDRLELVLSAGDTVESVRVPVTALELNAQVDAMRGLLQKTATRQYLRPAQQLYDWLVRPFEPQLAELKPETLVFVQDGALRMIPMGALYDSVAAQFLIEKVPLAVSPGLTLTNPTPISSNQVAVLAAGLTESSQDFRALPAVAQELEAVTAQFPTVALLDGAFVYERVEEELSERPFGIVHIASHGQFGGRGDESFLLTHNGRISMDQLGKLVRMTEFRDQPIDLLTLSACETAAGDERAGLGLAGLAVRSGARSALASLWSVNDAATAALIARFYEELKRGETSRAQALQRAQMQLLSDPSYRHPIYWSAFLLISSWL